LKLQSADFMFPSEEEIVPRFTEIGARSVTGWNGFWFVKNRSTMVFHRATI